MTPTQIMKKQYSLSDAELDELSNLTETGNEQGFNARWAQIGSARGFDPATVEGSPSSTDPHIFIAEPLPDKVLATNGDRGEWTSASNAGADLLCPGRHHAQRGIPDEESEDAASGQRIHAALAGKPSAAGSANNTLDLSLEERETFDMCREDEKALAASFFAGEPGGMKVYREERRWVQFDANGVRVAHSGMADLVYRQGSKALIVDYKVLRGDVPEAPENQQLRDLAVLNWRNLDLVTAIGTAIVQPWVTRKPKVCLYTQEDLLRAEREMFERVIKSNAADAPRIPGTVQCKFCKAKNKCQEHNQWIGSQLPVIAEPVMQAGLFQVAMEKWTPDQRALAASILPTLNKRLEEMKDWLKAGLAADASFIPGWHLKEGSKRKSITDVQKLFDRFTEAGGKLDGFFPAITVLMGEFRKSVAAVTGLKGKKLDAEIERMFDGITESKQAAPTLEEVK